MAVFSEKVIALLSHERVTLVPKTSWILYTQNSDVLGPLEVDSVGDSKYFISFIDDHSNWVVVYTMRKKSEALDRLIQFTQYEE